MKLLILTQAVDREDPVLGFFHRWLQEFAKHCDSIIVVCLRKGAYSLPKNVEVLSLGKEAGASRPARVARFFRFIISRRREYDAVFVHMNPEYVILGGLLWRLWRKKIGLWYTHKSVNLRLRIAVFFANVVFTASPESFRLASKKVRVMGHGIDVDFFYPDPKVPRSTAVLSVGRLSRIKHHDLVIRAAPLFPNAVRIAGEGPERRHLEELAARLSVAERTHFLGPQSQLQLRDEYRNAGVFVHVSKTGSLDKVVLEALACGLPVITTATTLADLPVEIISATPEAIAKAVIAPHHADTEALATYVREHHSLRQLIPAVMRTI